MAILETNQALVAECCHYGHQCFEFENCVFLRAADVPHHTNLASIAEVAVGNAINDGSTVLIFCTPTSLGNQQSSLQENFCHAISSEDLIQSDAFSMYLACISFNCALFVQHMLDNLRGYCTPGPYF